MQVVQGSAVTFFRCGGQRGNNLFSSNVNNLRHVWIILLKNNFFGFPKVKWLQYTDEVGKCTGYWCQIFSGFNTDTKSLKSFNFWQRYLKQIRWTFLGHSVFRFYLLSYSRMLGCCGMSDYVNKRIWWWFAVICCLTSIVICNCMSHTRNVLNDVNGFTVIATAAENVQVRCWTRRPATDCSTVRSRRHPVRAEAPHVRMVFLNYMYAKSDDVTRVSASVIVITACRRFIQWCRWLVIWQYYDKQ